MRIEPMRGRSTRAMVRFSQLACPVRFCTRLPWNTPSARCDAAHAPELDAGDFTVYRADDRPPVRDVSVNVRRPRRHKIHGVLQGAACANKGVVGRAPHEENRAGKPRGSTAALTRWPEGQDVSGGCPLRIEIAASGNFVRIPLQRRCLRDPLARSRGAGGPS